MTKIWQASHLFLTLLSFHIESGFSQNMTPSQARGPVDALILPENRYVMWGDLSDVVRESAMNLTWNNYTWNKPGTADIERLSFATLGESRRGLVETIVGSINTAERWDCFIDHYEGYSWAQLQAIQVDQYWTALGWTEATWNGSSATPPSSETTSWLQLSFEEQTAARELCYFQETWDEAKLLYWVTSNTGKPEVLSFPSYRFTPWNELDSAQQEAATKLNWDSNSWDQPGTAAVERVSWANLGSEQQGFAKIIGFDTDDAEAIWDCYVNHFRGYTWAELAAIHKSISWFVLGWNQTTWSVGSSSSSSYDGDLWAELSAQEQTAATDLCYNEELWDGLEFTAWNSLASVEWQYNISTAANWQSSAPSLKLGAMVGIMLLSLLYFV